MLGFVKIDVFCIWV